MSQKNQTSHEVCGVGRDRWARREQLGAPSGRALPVLLLAGAFLAGLSPLRLVAEETAAVARVGETEVKVDELRALLNSLDPRDRAALAGDPALLNRTVRAIFVQRLVLQEALAKQWDKQPAVIDQVERLRQNAIIESYLDAVAAPPASYPSDAELQSAYDSNRAAFLVPRQFRLSQIFIGAPKSPNKEETDKVQVRLDAVVKKLRQPESDFAAIAKAQSEESETAARGGEIGWLPETRIQPEIRLRVLGQAKDVVSEPIRLEDGWHIIKVLDVKEAYTAPLAEIRDQLTVQMRAERSKIERQNYLARLLQKSPVSINELAVSNVLGQPAK
jgi:peptidylprolyl isomerase